MAKLATSDMTLGEWVIPGRHPNADLIRERAASKINVSAMTNMLDGGVEKTIWRQKVQKMIESDPVFSNENNNQLPRTDRYRRGLEKCKRSIFDSI